MQDSVSGIFIDQKVDNIKLRTNKMSIIDKALPIQSLDIRGAKGDIRISAEPVNEKGSNSSPWSFSVANISLTNINESFDDSGKRIMAGISIEECKIKTRESDIKNKIIDISRFSLSGTSASLRINRAPKEGKNKNHADEFAFPWSIKCSDLDLENVSLSLGDYPDKFPSKTTEEFLMSNLNISMSELVLSRNSAGFASNNMSFDLNNGFSLKKFKGDLDSQNGTTSVNLSVETGNSQIKLSGSSDDNIFDLILKPEEIISARISLDKTKISLKDLLFFKTGLNKLPFINSLAKVPFTIKGDIIIQDSVFKIPDFYLSQASNIGLSLQGQIAGGLNPEKASGNLNFGIPDINTEWLTGILKEAGFNHEIKDLTRLSIEGTISDSLKSPHFKLIVKSDIGDIDLSGSLDFNKDSFKLASDLTRYSDWQDNE